MVILLKLLSSVSAVINHLKTLDESETFRVPDTAFCAVTDNLPLRSGQSKSALFCLFTGLIPEPALPS